MSHNSDVNFTVPSGWTLINETDYSGASFAVMYRFATGAENSETFVHSGGGGQVFVATVSKFSDVNASTPYESLTTSTANPSPITINALTSTVNNSLAVSFILNQKGGAGETVSSAPANYTERHSYKNIHAI